MPVSNNSILRIIDHQVYDGQEVLNQYFYEVDTSIFAPTAAAVAEAWWNDCNTVIRNLQGSPLAHIRVSCEELDGSQDYGEYIIPPLEQNGTQTGANPMSANTAYSITFRPVSRIVKPGGKRIAGVDESFNGSFGLISSGMISLLTDYGDHMIAQLNIIGGGAYVLTPKIVGFPTPERPTRVAVDMQGFVVNPYVSTQNTRKRGRGS